MERRPSWSRRLTTRGLSMRVAKREELEEIEDVLTGSAGPWSLSWRMG